jgi:cyclophilin family peptidyl-prolyl cis-trans isomerase
MRIWIWMAFMAGAGPALAQPPATRLPDLQLADNEEYIAHVQVTSGPDTMGTMTIRLFHQYAPEHVKSFVALAGKRFYDGTTFHRTKPEGFIQGGDPLSRDADPANDGTGGPGYDLPLAVNGKNFVRGTVGAANLGKRDNGSQFFVCLKEYPDWDTRYTAIGTVIRGIEVADRIAAGKRKDDHPIDDYVMTVRVEKRVREVKLY